MHSSERPVFRPPCVRHGHACPSFPHYTIMYVQCVASGGRAAAVAAPRRPDVTPGHTTDAQGGPCSGRPDGCAPPFHGAFPLLWCQDVQCTWGRPASVGPLRPLHPHIHCLDGPDPTVAPGTRCWADPTRCLAAPHPCVGEMWGVGAMGGVPGRLKRPEGAPPSQHHTRVPCVSPGWGAAEVPPCALGAPQNSSTCVRAWLCVEGEAVGPTAGWHTDPPAVLGRIMIRIAGPPPVACRGRPH